MTVSQLIILGVVIFIFSIFSAIAGGGGGFVITPLTIFFGMTPASAVATGKLGGMFTALGALSGMRGNRETVPLKRIIPIVILSLIIGIITPFIILKLESQFYRISLGVIIILMIPVLYFKKIGLTAYEPTLPKKIAGNILLALTILIQGIYSGGMGALVNIVLMGMLGMTAIEANVTKRWSQIALNITITIGVIATGLIDWNVAIVSMVCGLPGSYLGGKIAVSKGNRFVMNTMLFLMLLSGLGLIFNFGG